MGIGKHYSYSSYDNLTYGDDYKKAKMVVEKIIKIPAPPNPNPNNYVINNSCQIGKYLLVDITYPDCTNYEGRKLLLYKDVNIKDLTDQKKGIDPHFSDNKKFHSPIARFEPTSKGWSMAIDLIDYENDYERIDTDETDSINGA